MVEKMFAVKVKILPLYLVIWFGSCVSLSTKDSSGMKELGKEGERYYSNPVFEPILADPTVLKDPNSGYFYVVGTEDDWGDGQGRQLMPILRSVDLVTWEHLGNAFTSKPSWKSSGGLWAGDLTYIDDKYFLYYSYSIWADPNPAIGLAIADTPEGPYVDHGKLFFSDEIGVPNSIDPFYMEENGKKYLFWGSYNSDDNQGTYGIPLSNDGKSVPDFSKKVKIAAGDFEAVTIHKKGGYYYFIGSKGGCCDGANSTYNVRVARSKSLFGPYLDKNGRDIRDRDNGTLILTGNSKFAGPGHNSRIFTDDNGRDWMLYHGILKSNAKVSSGASRRSLMLDEVIWEDEWPKIINQQPSSEPIEAPYFRTK